MPVRVEIVAHRGASAHAPEHTFAAYDLALEMGADVLELDVRATRDGRLVVLHDPTLARTAGDPRAVAEVASAELSGEGRPPELDEVLDRYGRSTRWLVEMKDPFPSMEEQVVRSIASHGLREAAVVQSFDHASLRRVRRLDPGLEVAPLFCETWTESRVLAAMRGAGRYARSIGLTHAACTAAVAREARGRGLGLRAFTVNEGSEVARLMSLGIDGLITDRPGMVVAQAALRPV